MSRRESERRVRHLIGELLLAVHLVLGGVEVHRRVHPLHRPAAVLPIGEPTPSLGYRLASEAS
ncbi:MAG: hypothetical protein HKO87_04920 [Acidimicrobiia bacterium]|nr:hypothetical protein [Acidimicrobiia bacterium]NNK91755.1 hypothetical protein [Acidimicrobiia bacterium]